MRKEAPKHFRIELLYQHPFQAVTDLVCRHLVSDGFPIAGCKSLMTAHP
jgi:hypothetical protein